MGSTGENSWAQTAALASVPLALGAAGILGSRSRSSDTSVLEKIGQTFTPAPETSGVLCGAAALAVTGVVAHKTGLLEKLSNVVQTKSLSRDFDAEGSDEDNKDGGGSKRGSEGSNSGDEDDPLESIEFGDDESPDDEEETDDPEEGNVTGSEEREDAESEEEE